MGNCCKKRTKPITFDNSQTTKNSNNDISKMEMKDDNCKNEGIRFTNDYYGNNQNNGNNKDSMSTIKKKKDENSQKNNETSDFSDNSEVSVNNNRYDKILIGLNNIGATCYMNATLQCLSNTKKLTEFFMNSFEKYYEKNDDKKITIEYYKLLKHLWDVKNKNNTPYSPDEFKEVISNENPLFEGIQANDSKDLINFLLEKMHEELNKAPKNNIYDNNNNVMKNPNIQMDKSKILQIFLENFKNNYQSIISDIFYGTSETNYLCKSCGTVKYNYEIFFFLEFPLEQVNIYFGKAYNSNNYIRIKNNPDVDLLECFEYNKKEEYMTGENQMYCNICEKNCDAVYSTSLFSMPKYLIIILNRGKGNVYQCNVNFPQTLDLSKYIVSKGGISQYHLYAVICHLGPSSMSGHFIAFCRHRINEKWYMYNDDIVTECQGDEYLTGVPYILFYEEMKFL